MVAANVVNGDCVFESHELSSVAKSVHLYLLSPSQSTVDPFEIIVGAIVVPSFTTIYKSKTKRNKTETLLFDHINWSKI